MKAILPLIVAGTVTVFATGAPVINDIATITHVLNRAAFGPRTGDIDRVKAVGVERYIEQQLHPERIPDAAMAPRLAGFATLEMTSREISEQYEQPALEARRQKKQASGETAPAMTMRDPAQQRAALVMMELAQQKILRAVYSDRQLEEVLVDFWFNHFNVDARKGPVRFTLTEYERDTIRPHVLGRFRDLLGATAKSPAMLFYLDNWMSVAPNAGRRPPPVARRPASGARRPSADAAPQENTARRGLNENYARELMELHTLGVDGGYTQKDVTEVARAFTGWTIDRPRLGGSFIFRRQLHDPDPKVVLGHSIKVGGQDDAEQVLDILAAHPSTARFITTKLVRRFVSDDPPPALVNRAAERFRKTDGDLRDVMRTILMSPEFLSGAAINAKAKTPFEFVISSLRAAGSDISDARPFVRTLQELGMPLYQCQPPTGYKDTADAWISSGALVARMNVATRLARGDQQLALMLGAPEFQRR